MDRSPYQFQRAWTALVVCILFLSTGCNLLKSSTSLQDKWDKPDPEPIVTAPNKRTFRKSQYVFHADFDLQSDLPIFQELADLREEVYKELRLPTANTIIQVYLFEDRERYERFMHGKYPDLPKRRAFFVAQPHNVGTGEDLLVYTYWGDRIQEDLRHELTHALLHSVLKDVPLWLDEGLAEYFEVPPQWQGVHQHHLEQLRLNPGGKFKPDLVHLEELSQVQQMTPVEYRESWAWVHLMLRSRPEAKTVLTTYLQQLRVNPNPGPLQPRLTQAVPELEAALDRHLAQMDATSPPTPTARR
jgi:hypothetical protein